MKIFKFTTIVLIFCLTLIYSSCKKEEINNKQETTSVIDSNTTFSNNTIGYSGGSVFNANISFFGVQGDSTGYTIQGSTSSNLIIIKTGSSNFPATPPAVGSYKIYDLCDNCSHTLLPNEAIVVINDMAKSGSVNVSLSNGKYVYSFTNIEMKNSSLKWSGKLVSP
jgi:hypothetical protein